MAKALKGRDIRLDFFRGIALWMIFANHIPDNPLSMLATRRYGFSDGAEMFVFVSGCTAGLVYSRIAIDQGLAVDERVIVQGIQKVRPDMAVNPVAAQ